MAISLPDPSPLAIRFHWTGNLLWLVGTLWSFALPLLFLRLGLVQRLKRIAWERGRRWYPAFLIFVVGFYAFLVIGNLPLSFYSSFVREHAYGLSEQAFSKWAFDFVKAFLVMLAAFAAFLWVPFRLAARFPKTWWAILGALVVPYLLFTMTILPIWIAPLFNSFHPLRDKTLEAEITALASRAGIESARLFEVDKSVDTKRMNAYVVGFLGTKRIVLWDTLIRRMDRGEVLSVMGHEIGHFVLDHVFWGMMVAVAFTFLGLYLLHRIGPSLIHRWGEGANGLSDFAVLPLVYLFVLFYSFAVNPLGLAFSRHIEHEADRFALEITRDTESALRTEVKFIEKDLSFPRPWTIVKWLRYSHPPAGERFDFSASYKPWETGAPMRYGSYFR